MALIGVGPAIEGGVNWILVTLDIDVERCAAAKLPGKFRDRSTYLHARDFYRDRMSLRL
jgi:hypothetical protein